MSDWQLRARERKQQAAQEPPTAGTNYCHETSVAFEAIKAALPLGLTLAQLDPLLDPLSMVDKLLLPSITCRELFKKFKYVRLLL